MDDDSGKLGEVVELFSDITFPLKVDKLVKVSLKYIHWREAPVALYVYTCSIVSV